jgi:hypothetical protein
VSELHLKEFTAAFEKVALEAALESNLPSGVMAQLSAAISMKRIADAIEHIAQHTGPSAFEQFMERHA